MIYFNPGLYGVGVWCVCLLVCVWCVVCGVCVWKVLVSKARSMESQRSDGLFHKRELLFGYRVIWINAISAPPPKCSPPTISGTVSVRMLKLVGYNK